MKYINSKTNVKFNLASLGKLKLVFRDTTRNHPSPPYFSYKTQSTMNRARREVDNYRVQILLVLIKYSILVLNSLRNYGPFWKLWKSQISSDSLSLTCKKELYRAVYIKNVGIIPLLSPKFAISDWDKAARNMIKICSNNITVSGCMFHFNQRIIDHIITHQLGCLYKNNADFRRLIGAILALPLLPAEEIDPLITS